MPPRLRRRVTQPDNDSGVPIDISYKASPRPEYGTPEGRTPFGDGSGGWYHTPEVIEPTDCVNYPDSPFCGGNPFTKTPIGIDVEVSLHPCGVDVSVQGTLGFVKLPVHGVSYRTPGECRNDPPEEEENPITPGERRYEGFDIFVNPLIPVFAFVTNSETLYYTYTNPGGCGSALNGKSFSCTDGWTTTASNFRCPGDFHTVSGSTVQAPVSCSAVYTPFSTGFKYQARSAVSGSYCYDQPYIGSLPQELKSANYSSGSYIITYYHDEAGNVRQWKTNDGQSSAINNSVIPQYETSCCTPNSGVPLQIWKGYYRHIKFFVTRSQGAPNNKTIVIKLEHVVGTDCSYPIEKYPDNPPPPPLPKKKCCMSCCTPSTQQNQDTALLQQILAVVQKIDKNLGTYPFNVTLFDSDENKQEAQSKTIAINTVANGLKNTIDRVEKTSKMIGIDAFPITLPDTIIEEPEKGLLGDALNFLNPFKNRTIGSIAELIAWKIEQDSAVMGHWHQFIEMEVSTTDSKTGKTSTKNEKVVLPNMSQTMKELVVMNTQGMKITGLILDCCIKLLIEVAGTKLKAAEAAKRAEDLQQYLDYPTIEKWMDVPLQTDMPKKDDPQEKRENLHQFLQPSHVKVKFDDWTGEHSFQEAIIDLLNAARTIQAVYYKGQ
jgi:hypothetical protein